MRGACPPADIDMAPKFSVVIPTYNQADYLKVALRSVLDQTYQDYEVIVVNNYSTDHTLDVIRDAGDPRVQVINFHNQGVIGAGRNVGIRASRGTYVAFLDSDDTWYPNKLERASEVIEADPVAGLICHDQDLVRDGRPAGAAQIGPPVGFKGNMHDYLLLRGNCVSTSASVVARRHLEEVGLFSEDPAHITVEDYDLWLKLSTVCRFHFIPEVLGAHNFHPSSASANVDGHLHAALAVLDMHCGRLHASGRSYPSRAIRKRYANVYYVAARQVQRNSAAGQSHSGGAFRKALKYYLKTLMTYPLHKKAYAGLALFFADLLLGPTRRKRISYALWGPSWRWE